MVNRVNKSGDKIKMTILTCIIFIVSIGGCSAEKVQGEIATQTVLETEYNNLSKPIGHLISYQTKSKIDLSYGMSSPLKEVMKTYHSDIAHLPKKEQALFFYMVETNINVHGGEDLFDFYNFVYLACGEEYIKFLKQHSNNPYLRPERINLFLGGIEEREAQLKQQAKSKGFVFNLYLEKLKLEYGFNPPTT